MPVIFISQHSALDSNKPEQNTCRFNQVTKHVKYLSWNKRVWHMECEPLRSPLGNVISSDLYLSQLLLTPLREKNLTRTASGIKTNHSEWDFWEPKMQRNTRIHVLMWQGRSQSALLSGTHLYSCKHWYNIFNEVSFKSDLCLASMFRGSLGVGGRKTCCIELLG